MKKVEIYEAIEISAMALMMILYAMRLYRKNKEIKNAAEDIIDVEAQIEN